MVSDRSRKHLPPYVSYRTFSNFIDVMEKQGIPARIDRSYWGELWSGSTGTQLMSALRFLGLADNNGVPNARLRQLVYSKGLQKAEVLKQIASESFDVFMNSSLEPANATYAQLEDALHDTYQLTGGVARKCIKFFIEMASEAEIPLSSYVTKKSRAVRAITGTKRVPRKNVAGRKRQDLIPQDLEKVPDGTFWDKLLLSKFPIFDPKWPDDVKLKWFDAFDQLLKRKPDSN
ncbi:MAG: hypothetical protein ABIH70_08915 [Chloroflexota bacterium]